MAAFVAGSPWEAQRGTLRSRPCRGSGRRRAEAELPAEQTMGSEGRNAGGWREGGARLWGKSFCGQFPNGEAAPRSSSSLLSWPWKSEPMRAMQWAKCSLFMIRVYFKAPCVLKMGEGRVPCLACARLELVFLSAVAHGRLSDELRVGLQKLSWRVTCLKQLCRREETGKQSDGGSWQGLCGSSCAVRSLSQVVAEDRIPGCWPAPGTVFRAAKTQTPGTVLPCVAWPVRGVWWFQRLRAASQEAPGEDLLRARWLLGTEGQWAPRRRVRWAWVSKRTW